MNSLFFIATHALALLVSLGLLLKSIFLISASQARIQKILQEELDVRRCASLAAGYKNLQQSLEHLPDQNKTLERFLLLKGNMAQVTAHFEAEYCEGTHPIPITVRVFSEGNNRQPNFVYHLLTEEPL